jgi:rhamnosyltransferase
MRTVDQPLQNASDAKSRSVCAVVVTYHPAQRMMENLRRVCAQVQAMVVVDNGSSFQELSLLRDVQRDLGFELITNGENLGIAEALNQGIRRAKDNGYSWVILFDQDSSVPDGFVSQMFESWSSHTERERVAAVHPKYRDPKTGLEGLVRRAKDGGPITSMTSGALMPTWVFDKIGWFASEYFIDCVDTEYCFRIRASGYLIADSATAELPHAPGSSQVRTILGFSFRSTHHSTMRRYYMSRNRIAVFRKYVVTFPRWASLSMYDSLRETVKCVLGEPDRSVKFRRFLLGTWDGLVGRMGKREGL